MTETQDQVYVAYFDCCTVAVETDESEGPIETCPECGGSPRETVLTDETSEEPGL